MAAWDTMRQRQCHVWLQMRVAVCKTYTQHHIAAIKIRKLQEGRRKEALASRCPREKRGHSVPSAHNRYKILPLRQVWEFLIP